MRPTTLIPIALLVLLLAGGTLLCCNGCTGANQAELPADESQIRVVGAPTAPAASPGPAASSEPAARPTPAATREGSTAPASSAEPLAVAAAPAPPLPPLEASVFTPLEVRGVRGGQLDYEIDGSVDDVVAMLLDQDGAAGHRAWAQTYRQVSREGDRVVGEWHFRGKMGVNPVVHLEFVTTRDVEGARIRYRVVKKAMGISSFFGDYRIERVSETPARSRLTARVFIDSGLPFVNASHQDIQDGLREDAKLLREWIGQRRSPSAN